MNSVLAIDTATGPCSVAIWKNGNIAAYGENRKPMAQSACLLPMVEAALAEAGIGYADLSAVACTVGPGSFTGIRVGLSAARGIALAAGIPGLGFTTLEVLAFAAGGQDKEILALLNAGKGEAYFQHFITGWQPGSPPGLANLTAIRGSIRTPLLTVGNLHFDQPEFTVSPVTFPRADALATLAAGHSTKASLLTPFYIRAPDAKPLGVIKN